MADLNKNIARDYDVLFGERWPCAALFLIDKKGMVRHAIVNDLPLGRNVDEALRMVDALQFPRSTARSARPAGERATKP